ncbi:MAG: SphA family protein [Paracoccaceae bacterium]
MNKFWKKSWLWMVMAAGLGLLMLSPSANAEEGGTGHYLPGGAATLIDMAPTQPGWVLEPIFLSYNGGFSSTVSLPVGGEVSVGLDAKINSLTLGGLYTFDQTVLGAHYSLGVYAPYVWMDVTGTVAGLSRTDSAEGFGDITIIPAMLAWKSGPWQYDAMLSIYAPTGKYQTGSLANLGLNYWTVDPTISASYSNEKTGFTIGVHAGVTFNTANKATDYHSGSVLHAEFSTHQLFSAGPGILGLGVNGFIYEQIFGDSGSGATAGGFKGRSMGIGPVIDYILPTKTGALVIEAKWLPELDTKNRLEGDYFWGKVAWQF